MKIQIAADMEGITGVVHWDDVDPGHPEYARFRRLMTGDVNAAIQGAFEGGADEVLVSDGHHFGRNILVEELDSRALLISGNLGPLAMVQGVENGVDAVIFVGYHARVGTQYAILEHTWSSTRVANLLVQGEPMGEIGLNAAVCGHFNVPVIMISGDHAACSEASKLIEGVLVAEIKKAYSRMTAELLPPAVTQERIRKTAAEAVAKFQKGSASKPLRLSAPIKMAIEFTTSEMADNVALMNGTSRRGRWIEHTSADAVALYRTFQVLVDLARS